MTESIIIDSEEKLLQYFGNPRTEAEEEFYKNRGKLIINEKYPFMVRTKENENDRRKVD